MLYLTLVICSLFSFVITPKIKTLAIKIGATDQPNHRKVHLSSMPRLGGLAIFFSTLLGLFILKPIHPALISMLIGSFIIILTGVLDDLYEISAKYKLLGQLIAAIVVIYGGVIVKFINLPLGIQLELGLFSIPLTLLWIIVVTNAINLIDGLDGLAAGISSIVLFTISIMAMINGNEFVMTVSLIILASTLGFLPFNFHPAKIFMGDTGALFLGFIISVISLLGFKNITLFSLLVPIIILGVPLSDTFFAIVRRLIKRQPLSTPDKSHFHHCLIRLGFSHQSSVLLMYLLSTIFAVAALIFEQTTLWGSYLVIITLILFTEILVEVIGLVDKDYKPILNLIRKVLNTR
ncbi:MraY family glycosyltransferase [Bacillus pinisoli]|uniref:MraY family glycosyltransferase n=1 Tax=Bacillus pinisoli TaxID=2901866 RepID=UPI001FF4F8CB|nr:MraY family glycosyltransferase [Bacillus pinisoli]